MSEFALIERCFTRTTAHTLLGIGDDAALLAAPPGEDLAITTDTLVSGTHFFPDAEPRMLGRKALAVNLSDLAAMGAQPRWALLALTLPERRDAWCDDFSHGLLEQAARYQIELIGGDTTRGPLAMSLTLLGSVPRSQALRRDRARAGDDLWLSGCTGEAALALACLKRQWQLPEAHLAACLRRLHDPTPRVELGIALRGVAHSAIDVSDGLIQDLGHLCRRSALAARLELDAIPRPAAMHRGADSDMERRCLLGGGDDYELLFSAAPAQRPALAALSQQLQLPLTRIGHFAAGNGIYPANDPTQPLELPGYDHFA